MELRIGKFNAEVKIDLIELEDFIKGRNGEIICKVIESVIFQHYQDEMRQMLKLDNTLEAQKIESYITGLEDVVSLIRNEIPSALRENP